MKKYKLLLLFVILTAALLVLSACPPVGDESVVVSMSVKHAPTKVFYALGDKSLSLDGGVIEVVLGDNSVHELDMTDERIEISEFDATEQGEVRIDISYYGKTASFYVIVGNIAAKPVSMEVGIVDIGKYPPVTVYYTDSTRLHLNQGFLRLHYDNNSTYNISMDSSSIIKEYDFSTPGSKEIKFTYKISDIEVHASLPITVKENRLNEINTQLIIAQSVSKLGDETILLYMYRELSAKRAEILSDANPDMEAEFANKFGQLFNSFEEYYKELYSFFYTTNVYYEPEFIAYLDVFLPTAFKYKGNITYKFSEEFKTNALEIERLFNALSLRQQTLALASINGKNHEYLYNIMKDYYAHFLNAEELYVYTRMFETDVFFKFVIFEGGEYDNFSSCIKQFVKSYGELENKTLFNSMFRDRFEPFMTYYDTYESAIAELSGLYEYIRNSDGLEGAFVAMITYNDLTYLTMYYPEFVERVDAVYASGDTYLIEAFETFLFDRLTLKQWFEEYKVYWDEGMSYVDKIYDPNLPAFYAKFTEAAKKWFFADGPISYKAAFDEENLAKYPEFFTDMEEIVAEYWALSDRAKFNFITVSDFTFKSMCFQYYRPLLSESEFVVFDLLHDVVLTHIQYKYLAPEHNNFFKTNFTKQMSACKKLYEELENSDKLDADAGLMSVYATYLNHYNTMIAAQAFNPAEQTAYSHMLDAQIYYRSIMYDGVGYENFVESIKKFIDSYDSLNDKTLFNAKLLDQFNPMVTFYNDYKDVFEELNEIYALISDKENAGGPVTNWLIYGDMTLLNINYPEFQNRIGAILSGENAKLQFAYENFLYNRKTLEEWYTECTGYYNTVILYVTDNFKTEVDQNLPMFLIEYIHIARKWYNAGGLPLSSEKFTAKMLESYPEFFTDMKNLMGEYWELNDEAKSIFQNVAGYIFKSMSYQYYRDYLSVKEFPVFDALYNVVLSHINYENSTSLTYQNHYKNLFINQMRACEKLYQGLENSALLDADEAFSQAYTTYLGYFKAMTA